jgi:biopolymer transport protein ExbD
MIDTIFFLLVFFMLSSLALVKLNGLPVNLPKAETAEKQQPNNLTITIDKSRRIYINKVPVDPESVSSTLLSDIGPNSDLINTSVVINADQSVPEGLVVGCIDASRKVGINSFTIATAPEDQSAVQ